MLVQLFHKSTSYCSSFMKEYNLKIFVALDPKISAAQVSHRSKVAVVACCLLPNAH